MRGLDAVVVLQSTVALEAIKVLVNRFLRRRYPRRPARSIAPCAPRREGRPAKGGQISGSNRVFRRSRVFCNHSMAGVYLIEAWNEKTANN